MSRFKCDRETMLMMSNTAPPEGASCWTNLCARYEGCGVKGCVYHSIRVRQGWCLVRQLDEHARLKASR